MGTRHWGPKCTPESGRPAPVKARVWGQVGKVLPGPGRERQELGPSLAGDLPAPHVGPPGVGRSGFGAEVTRELGSGLPRTEGVGSPGGLRLLLLPKSLFKSSTADARGCEGPTAQVGAEAQRREGPARTAPHQGTPWAPWVPRRQAGVPGEPRPGFSASPLCTRPAPGSQWSTADSLTNSLRASRTFPEPVSSKICKVYPLEGLRPPTVALGVLVLSITSCSESPAVGMGGW